LQVENQPMLGTGIGSSAGLELPPEAAG